MQKNKTKNEDTMKLNKRQTFENYVEVESNSFAYKLLTSFPDNKDIDNNLICIYGPIGIGKTHLLNAVGNKLQNTDKKIVSVTMDQIVNDFTKNLRQMTMDVFRDKYYKCDVLLIDDLDYARGKRQTQEELYLIVSNLLNDNKHIVITSTDNPKSILGLNEGFTSYLNRSLQVELQKPDADMTLTIAKSMFDKKGVECNLEIMNYIAEHIAGDINKLEGIIKTLDAQTKLMSIQPTFDNVKKLIGDIDKSTSH